MSDSSSSVDAARARARAIADANVKNADAAYNHLEKAYNDAIDMHERLLRDRSTLISVESTLASQREAILSEKEKLERDIYDFQSTQSSYETALDNFNINMNGILSEVRSIQSDAMRAYRHAEDIIAAAAKLTGYPYHDGTELRFVRLGALDDQIDLLAKQTEELRSIDRVLSRDYTAEISDAIMAETQKKLSDMSDDCRETYRQLTEKCTALKALRDALSEYLR